MTKFSVQQRYQAKLFPGSSHTWALKQLESFSPQARVLDIGPGSGVIGEALRQRGFERLSAIEIDPEARENLKPIYSRIEMSLDPYERDGSRFDLVLLLDVLEHMAQPFEFLARVRSLLPNGAGVLISVPNIAHWSMRLCLLFGFFEYTNRGLLDQTHLQFFNRRRFERLITSHGFRAQQRDATIEPLELLLPDVLTQSVIFSAISTARAYVARCLPGLMGYQLLAVIRAV